MKYAFPLLLCMAFLMPWLFAASSCHAPSERAGEADHTPMWGPQDGPPPASNQEPDLEDREDEAAKEKRLLSEMKEALGENFLVKRVDAFYVAGDLKKDAFDRFCDYTIRDCSRALCRQYFDTEPDQPIRVYLFDGDKSYRRWAKKLFDDEPTTPYGYYKSRTRTLVMNIATGGGTLVHEMVHALMDFDWPEVPAWFNEGLGSLYEQCRIEKARLVGLLNWRYRSLRRAIDDETLIPMRTIMGTTRREFYNDDDKGLHYAQARYFLMYLQHLGRLEEYYAAFHKAHLLTRRRDRQEDEDATGIATLERLMERSVEEIEADWILWAKSLSE